MDVIQANHLGKKYTIVDDGGNRDFWALQDVTFSVESGDAVGIVGKNGSGKSTLLKIVARVVTPTRGYVDVWGKVGSMLELGAGFHPELTGRENIRLSGVILGIKRSDISQLYNSIIEFSELEKFIDMPLKYYSSGMQTRLAFSVSSHLNSDILLIDEVLSVGDFEFQKKCIEKIKEISGDGKTILFVSHDLSSVETICNKALHLLHGNLVQYDEVHSVVSSYLKS
jgi:lipopolysaccharide transport system ATP-binding protein